MKILTSKLLLLFCLATASGVANAQERFDSRQGFQAVGSLEWRLGNSRGRNGGYEILFRDSGRDRWRAAPGYAVAIGDGWVLGTDRHRGGYGIYRWNGHSWKRMPGTAVRIGGSYQQPWVINEFGIRFVWSGRDWREDRNAGRYDNRDRRDRDFDRNNRRGRDRDDDRNRRDRDDDRDDRDNDGRDYR